MPQKLIYNLTHNELVKIARRWLRNTEKCSVVVSEISSAAGEEPDAIGWKSGFSTLVECKATLDDFHKDKRKIVRRVADPTINFGMGQYRYYMVPEGLLGEDPQKRLPRSWGLLEVTVSGRVKRSVPATQWVQCPISVRREMQLILSALRRYQEKENAEA
jgi:hypothetical protein